MEKVWRKVNQGLSSNKNSQYKTDTTDSAAGFDEETNVVAIAEQKLKHSNNEVLIENRSAKLKRRRKGNARKNISRVEQVVVNELSLREKAVARLKLFNFNLNWDLQMSQCKPCGSKPGNILTRRLYRNRRQNNDNELYRSNSFKFERFERREDTDNVIDTEKRKISVCDDYSLPIDFLKKRPSSFDPSLTTHLPQDWNSSSLASKQSELQKTRVKFIEGYSQPKDTKVLLDIESKHSLRSQIDNSQEKFVHKSFELYSDSSQPKSSENESECKINSPDNISDDFICQTALDGDLLSNTEVKPSPYYYSDIAKRQSSNISQGFGEVPILPKVYKKRDKSQKQTSQLSRKTDFSVSKEKTQDLCCASSSSLTSEDSNCSECKNRRNWHAQALAHVQATCNVSVDLKEPNQSIDQNNSDIIFTSQAIFGSSRDIRGSSNCSLDDNSEIVVKEDMSNSVRKVYETAFDSMVASNYDDTNMIDNITKNPRLFPFPSDQLMISNPDENNRESCKQKKNSINQTTQDLDNVATDTLSKDMQGLLIKKDILSCKTFDTHSPPSTAPLPLKFPLKIENYFSNSIQSTPNIPNSNALQHPRLLCLRSNVREAKKAQQSSSGFIPESIFKKYNEAERPHSVIGVRRLNQFQCSQENKKRKFKEFTSAESMRSSNISIDSMRSSTSEEARSTSSSESHRSPSISSHDSDSGTNNLLSLKNHHTLNNKLHILSPISDKSVQDPDTELLKTWDTSKLCPLPTERTVNEENENGETEFKNIIVSNKLISSLATQEIRGSDSGISLQSRDDPKPKLLFNMTVDESVRDFDVAQGLKDLPFDMPKLRRRRFPTKNDISASGSATSVELGELPVDLLELKPSDDLSKFEFSQTISDEILLSDSQKTTNNELKDIQRQSLTLDFNNRKGSKPLKFGTDGAKSAKNKLFDLGLNKYNSNLIDINTPFEKQNWYHGAISRIEAENILRTLDEGSFLVRNSESTKQDYSLSLKSAKGFMHMRIQKTGDSNQYILGQFSRPFNSIPEMIHHFCLNRLPVRGAEHMCLVEPVIVQIL